MRKEITERPQISKAKLKGLDRIFSKEPDTSDIPEITDFSNFKPLYPEKYEQAKRLRELRRRTGVSQSNFAKMIGVSVGTLRNWEQGRRKPEGAARALLKIVEADPEYVKSILMA